MIRLGAFFGPEFNQNGDLGNLTVLGRALQGRGQSIRIELEVQHHDALVEVDFLVVGDGSLAHQRARQSELKLLADVVAERRVRGKWTLLVGSSYRQLAQPVFGSTSTSGIERRSGFFTTDVSGSALWGYMNTESDLAPVVIQDRVIGTEFFGPFLARNPSIIQLICEANSWQVDPTFVEQLNDFMAKSPNYREAQRHRL